MAVNSSFNVVFKQMQNHFRGKLLKLPTESWRDIQHSAHSKAFVIAGATKAALLEDVFEVIDRNIESGKGYNEFRKEFRQKIVEHGWLPAVERFPNIDRNEILKKLQSGEKKLTNLPKDYQKYLGWRTQIIYDTNMHTSYMAGNWEQIQEAKEYLPFLRYRHGYYGEPVNPREQHVALDGVTLPADDSFWDTHYPPNGWNCSCGVEQISAQEANVTPKENIPNVKIDQTWAYNTGKTDDKAVISVFRHVERMVEKGGDYKIVGDKTWENLAANTGAMEGMLESWHKNYYAKGEIAGRQTRAVAVIPQELYSKIKSRFDEITQGKKGEILGTPILSMSLNDYTHAARKEHDLLTVGDFKKIPEIIKSPDVCYIEPQGSENNATIFMKKRNPEFPGEKKYIKVVVKPEYKNGAIVRQKIRTAYYSEFPTKRPSESVVK